MTKELYIETSVWNQFEHDDRPEWRKITANFFEMVQQGMYTPVISDIVLQEIYRCGDKKKMGRLLNRIEKHRPFRLSYDEEAQSLRNKYIEAGIMTDTKLNRFYDTAHVAVASVNHLMYILTFNFDHLLKVAKIEAFNGINILNGYAAIQLVTPEMFLPETEGNGNVDQ